MKTLQNNFTTPEQSKWLLGLGVPANSADCLFYKDTDICSIRDFWQRQQEDFFDFFKDQYTPCWSVGRLIEIYHICDRPGCSFSFNVCFPNLINEMIYKIVEAKEHGWIDFSKLEE